MIYESLSIRSIVLLNIGYSFSLNLGESSKKKGWAKAYYIRLREEKIDLTKRKPVIVLPPSKV